MITYNTAGCVLGIHIGQKHNDLCCRRATAGFLFCCCCSCIFQFWISFWEIVVAWQWCKMGTQVCKSNKTFPPFQTFATHSRSLKWSISDFSRDHVFDIILPQFLQFQWKCSWKILLSKVFSLVFVVYIFCSKSRLHIFKCIFVTKF